jgi:ABC-type branched-chain amino acid transport systems, ATPase component
MLEVQDLHVYYGEIHALKGVSFQVGQGEIVTLLGSNGAGKTTTLKAVSGLLAPRGGDVRLEGTSLVGTASHDIVLRGITHVPEGRRIFNRLTVFENLEMGAYTRSDKGVAEDVERVFAIFPRLKERRIQVAGTLSGGEQQMLAIGRALMTNPRLLILDEATEGLAPLIRAEIWQCLTKLKAAGQSILVIDKNVQALIRIADRHYLIERGKVVWTGSSEALAAAPDIQHRFLGV